jgi:TolB-like protein
MLRSIGSLSLILLAIPAVLEIIACPANSFGSGSYEDQVNQLAARLSESVQKSGKKTVAVVDFTNLSGDVTELGRFLAEELSVSLTQKTGGFEIIDRTYLKAILQEHKLVSKGIIDPLTARKLGQIAGVDGLITGSVTPFGDSVRLSVKVLDTATARVIGAASTDIPKTKAIEELLAKGLSGTSTEDADTSRPSKSTGVSTDATAGGAQAANQVHDNEFVFQMKSCRRSGKTITCSGVITNKGPSTRDVWFDFGESYFVDDLGNQYQYQPKFQIQLGAQGQRQNLEPELPMTFVAWAEAASLEARSMSLVLVYGFNQRNPDRAIRSARLSLRGIPIQ